MPVVGRRLHAVWTLLVAGVFGALLAVSFGFGDRASAADSVDPSSRFDEVPVPAGLESSPRASKLGRELTELRTRTSRTYEGDNGALVARVFAAPVNFRDGQGRWQAIDNRLQRQDGTLRNASNDYQLVLPQQLDTGPVRVADGDDWVTFQLRDAAGSADVAGNRARYADARPGVDAIYSALSGSVKEELVLRDRSSTRRFTFDLKASAGLVPRLTRSGAIEFRNARGATKLTLGAPMMADAAGAFQSVKPELEPVGDGWILRLSPSDAWLDSPQRKYPVVLDPDVYKPIPRDCFMRADDAESSFCSWAILVAGYGYNTDWRSLMHFDLAAAVPGDAEVLYGQVSAKLKFASTTTSKPLSLHAVTRDWTGAASWNRHDGVNPWISAGGDHEAATAAPPTWVNSTVEKYKFFEMTSLARRWVRGEPNHGMLLRDAPNEPQRDNQLQFYGAESSYPPYLHVEYTRRVGERAGYTFEPFQLSDRLDLRVNPAGGNLMLRQTDVSIAGVLGPDVKIAPTYNSLGGSSFSNDVPGFGQRFELDVPRLQFLDNNDVIMWGETGWIGRFYRQADGSFKHPAGYEAKLERTADGGAKVTEHQSSRELVFNPVGRLATLADRNGHKLSYAYSADNKRLESITDSQGRITTIAYGASGEVETITDSAGRTTSYAYAGTTPRLATTTDAEGGITRLEHNGTSGQLSKITTPAGREVLIDYYPSGDANHRRVRSITRVTASTADIDPKTEFIYSQRRDGTSSGTVRDPEGRETVYELDAEGRPIEERNAAGTQQTSYTGNHDVKTETDANGATTTLDYDSKENLTSVAEASGEQTTRAFESTAHPFEPTAETNPQGNTLQFSYDTAGNLTSIANGLATQNKHVIGRNPDGSVASVTDAVGNVTTYNYDAKGHLTSIVQPTPLGPEKRSYDSLSRLVNRTDGAGRSTSWTYDGLDRITSATFGDDSKITYTYDKDGFRTGRTDGTSPATTTYDELGRVTEETRENGKKVTYAYNRAGNLTALTDDSGTTGYAYDASHRLSSITEPDGAKTAFGYDAEGRRTSTVFPNGTTETRTYTASGLVTLIVAKDANAAVLLKRDYTYTQPVTNRKTGLVQRVIDEDGRTTEYGYDALDRLVKATTKAASGATLDEWSYTYDGAGNRLTATHNGTTTSSTYNAANQLTQAGGTTFAYDAAGGETSNSTGRKTTYNARGQAASVTGSNGTALEMRYAGEGQTERLSAGDQQFAHSQLGVIGVTNSAGTIRVTRDNAGELAALRTANGKRYYYLTDALGSVIGLAGPSGDLAAAYRYDPFGATINNTGNVENAWLYAGEHLDATGLYKIGERYYDAQLGRWTQQDPLDQYENVREANRYLYAGANTVNVTDPSGECWGCAAKVVVKGAKRVWNTRGMPRAKVGIHNHAGGPHRGRHLQVNVWRHRVKGRPKAWRVFF
jgi:RHS repeat-associated protein